MKRKSRNMFMISLTLALVVWAGYAFVLWDMSVRNHGITEVAVDLEVNERRHVHMQEAVSLLEGVEEDLAGLDDFFLRDDSRSQVQFMERVEAMGRDRGVDGLSFETIQTVDNEEEERHLAAQVEVRGQWDAVMETVALLELLPFKISVVEKTMRSDGDGTWTATIQMRASLSNDE